MERKSYTFKSADFFVQYSDSFLFQVVYAIEMRGSLSGLSFLRFILICYKLIGEKITQSIPLYFFQSLQPDIFGSLVVLSYT